MEPKTITITVHEYRKLAEASEFLARLHAAGVDNWDGYSEACGEDEESEEDIYG